MWETVYRYDCGNGDTVVLAYDERGWRYRVFVYRKGRCPCKMSPFLYGLKGFEKANEIYHTVIRYYSEWGNAEYSEIMKYAVA